MQKLLLAVILTAILTACGGGDDDTEAPADRVPTPTLDCKATPELCR